MAMLARLDFRKNFYDRCGQSMRNVFVLVVLAVVSASVTATPKEEASTSVLKSEHDRAGWLNAMSMRVESQIPDKDSRVDFLKVVLDESNRARLNPQLVLSVIDVASGFKKYAVSQDGARGYMQIEPSWTRTMEDPDANLFHLRTNIRYGCTLLRYFLDLEKDDLVKALARYGHQMRGAAGTASGTFLSRSDFPEKVEHLTKTRWGYDGSRE